MKMHILKIVPKSYTVWFHAFKHYVRKYTMPDDLHQQQ